MLGLGIGLSAVIIGCCCVSLYLAHKATQRYERLITGQIVAFLTAPEEGHPSPLAQLVQLAGKTAGAEVAASLKGAFMGHSSALAKAENAIAEDVLVDSAGAWSPLLGLILQSFPRLTKRLAKSPAAAAALSQIDLGSLLGGGGGGGNGMVPGGDDVSGRIGRR